MKGKQFLLFIGLVFFSATQIFSQEAKSPERLLFDFFETYQKDVAKALDNIYETNKWLAENTKLVNQVKEKLTQFDKNLVGDYYGAEMLDRKLMGESYRLYSYLVKYERQPLKFSFEFYKPKDKWVLISFRFNANISEEIQKIEK